MIQRIFNPRRLKEILKVWKLTVSDNLLGKRQFWSRGVTYETFVLQRSFSEEQMKWLEMIRDYIAINASFQVDALKSGEFNKMGGTAKYYSLFGSQWKDIINELNQKLVA